MPLPVKDTPWPPRQLATIAPKMLQWSAWYEGTPEALQYAYGRNYGTATYPGDARVTMARDNRNGGIRGVLARFWWGRPINNQGGLLRDMLHVPIAADLCQASADLLFAEQPQLRASKTNTKLQDRLDELGNDGLFASLAEAAEVAAALGGVYLRVTWDKDLRADAPFTTVLDADTALPEFQWGILRAVTFWQIVGQEGQTVWRHLERHELDANGNGVIQHALYMGTADNLGRTVPLADRPETAVFVAALNEEGVIDTQTPGLAVVYIPNQRPQRTWRRDPLGRQLGRSDLDGVESLMDALDETYSSWMRDVRLGKARILAAKSMLEGLGPGAGATFDNEQEIYSPLNMIGSSTTNASGLPIEQVQFKIRFAEHKATAEQWVSDILRTAGYSAQTFGEQSDITVQRTATEVDAREQRSLLTRERKIRHWRPGLQDYLEKLISVDVKLFAGTYTAERPDVKFSDGVQESQLSLAQTALALKQAEAASTEVLVALVHPDWEDDDVQAEVVKIKAEAAAAAPPMPNPDHAFGPDGQPIDPNDPASSGQQ